MDSKTRLLYWLFIASRGGPTRLKIIKSLLKEPLNLNKLAKKLEMDYKTICNHIDILIENNLIYAFKKGYGGIYFITPEWEEKIIEFMRNVEHEKKG